MSLDVLHGASAGKRQGLETLVKGFHGLGNQGMEDGNEFGGDVHADSFGGGQTFDPLVEGGLACAEQRMGEDPDGEGIGVRIASGHLLDDFSGGCLPFIHHGGEAAVGTFGPQERTEVSHLSEQPRDIIGLERFDDRFDQWHGISQVADGIHHGSQNLMQRIGIDRIHRGEVVEERSPGDSCRLGDLGRSERGARAVAEQIRDGFDDGLFRRLLVQFAAGAGTWRSHMITLRAKLHSVQKEWV